MKKVFIVAALFLTACHGDSISQEKKGDFEVEFLFEQDGIKVYRFLDGRYHYFTNKGETITTQHAGKSNWQETIN